MSEEITKDIVRSRIKNWSQSHVEDRCCSGQETERAEQELNEVLYWIDRKVLEIEELRAEKQ